MLLLYFHSLQIKIEKNLTHFKMYGQGADLEPKGLLQINKVTGEITVHRPVDYEKFKLLKVRRNFLEGQYCIDLKAQSVCVGVCNSYFTIHALPLQLTFQAFENHVIDTLGIEIQIIDSNDNSPKFDPDRYEISIPESTKQGQFLLTISCYIYCYYEMVISIK